MKSDHNVVQERISVHLPDMFVSFLSKRPKVNPHYAKIKMESEDWINRTCNFDDHMQKRIRGCDFSFFCSISAPEAEPEELRTMCDWGNWVFPWDDMFDNGDLRHTPDKARQMMESLMSAMRQKESPFPKTALVEVHDTVWHRIEKTSPIGVQRRFYEAMKSYCSGALEHVDRESHANIPSIQEQLATRRRSSGVTPLFALVEYAHRLDLPDQVFKHPSIKELQRIGTDLVLLQNDILSYRKEEAEGVNHNLVAICRINGMSAQRAFDHVNDMLRQCYRDWYIALSELPQWGEKIDEQVQKYVQGVQDVVHANLNWSFKSQRYLGPMHDVIRQTREITVLPRPADDHSRGKNIWTQHAVSTRWYGAWCLLVMLLASVGLSVSAKQYGPTFT